MRGKEGVNEQMPQCAANHIIVSFLSNSAHWFPSTSSASIRRRQFGTMMKVIQSLSELTLFVSKVLHKKKEQDEERVQVWAPGVNSSDLFFFRVTVCVRHRSFSFFYIFSVLFIFGRDQSLFFLASRLRDYFVHLTL